VAFGGGPPVSAVKKKSKMGEPLSPLLPSPQNLLLTLSEEDSFLSEHTLPVRRSRCLQ